MNWSQILFALAYHLQNCNCEKQGMIYENGIKKDVEIWEKDKQSWLRLQIDNWNKIHALHITKYRI